MAQARPYRNHETQVAASGPVLIVDDDSQLRRMIRWLLEDEGLSVETAATGEEAIAQARLHPPALVILDLNLPVRTGEAVAEELRSVHGAALPIVVISSDGKIAQRARRLGASHWLSKPFEIDDLVVAIRQALYGAA